MKKDIELKLKKPRLAYIGMNKKTLREDCNYKKNKIIL